MAQPEEKMYTIDDVFALPDGVRAELINGQIYYLAAPSRRHSNIVQRVKALLINYIEENSGSCEVHGESLGVFLHDDDLSYFLPDIFVVCDLDKLDDRGCHGAPELVIEVISPSTKYNDYFRKSIEYQSAGVREYWIVDPDKCRITVYDFVNQGLTEYSFDDIVPVGIFDHCSIDFKRFQAFL